MNHDIYQQDKNRAVSGTHRLVATSSCAMRIKIHTEAEKACLALEAGATFPRFS